MNIPRELLVFEHIPKTAGSTMRGILRRLYGGKHVFVATHAGRHPERIEALRQRLEDPENEVKAVVAHTGFGFHERLPEGYRFRHYTFLRDPIERVISHYHYQIQREKLDPSTSLETFVREDLGRSCNVQTAFLGGLEVQRYLDGITLSPELYTEALLEKAKANLRRLDTFGLTECFDESLLRLGKVFGWKTTRLFYVRRRVGRRPQTPNYPPSALKLIRQYNELGLELYRYGQALYDEQRAALLPNGSLDVETFQKLNRIYAAVFTRAYPVVQKARGWTK